ncbi:MAG: hypothetical protein ACPGU1_19645 [Myxococcota bacterium]
MIGRPSQWAGALLLGFLAFGLPSTAGATEATKWVTLSDFEAPESALRVFGNALPPTAEAAALWRGAQSASGPWANPVVCRVNYRRSFVPGELDLNQGVCVLFMHTRQGSETECTSRDAVCRIHVPLGAGVEVLAHADTMHLIPLVNGAKAVRGTVALDTDGLTGKWRLCLQGGHVGATEQSKVDCVTGSGGKRGGVDFGYGDSAATEGRQLAEVSSWVAARRAGLMAVLKAAQAAQSTVEIDKALVAVKAANQGAESELAPLLDGLEPVGAQKARDIIAHGLGDVTKALRFEAQTLTRRRDVAEALANIDALVGRVDGTLAEARDAVDDDDDDDDDDEEEEEAEEAAELVKQLDRYAGSLNAVLSEGVLDGTSHAERAARLKAMSREIGVVLERLEPRLSSDARTARLAHHIERLSQPRADLRGLGTAVTAFKRLQKVTDPFDAQRGRVALVEALRSQVLAAWTQGLYVAVGATDDAAREHVEAMAGFEAAFDGWRALPKPGEDEPEAEEVAEEVRRLRDVLESAGLSWQWQLPARTPAWDAAWTERPAPTQPPGRRVEGPRVVEKAKGWIVSTLGDALSPPLKYWFVCIGAGRLEGSPSLATRIGRCIAAQEGLGPMVDDEPLGDASEPLEAVEGEWATLLTALESGDHKRCKGVLKAHAAHKFAVVIEAACVKAKAADKEHAKDRAAQKKIAKIYGRMKKAMEKGKWKKASKSLKAIQKKNKRGVLDEALIDQWRASIDGAQAEGKRRKAEAKAEKRRLREQKTMRKRVAKLMRKVPRHAAQCLEAKATYAEAVRQSGAAAMDGDLGRAKQLNALKDKTRRKACDLQAKVLVVHQLHEALGDAAAAQAVKRETASCFQGWECR